MEKSEVNISYLFQSAQETKEPEEVTVEGKLPEWLISSFLQVGPGLFDFGEFTMNYWLDGYGMISKFDINGQNSTVTLTKKYVQSEAYQRLWLRDDRALLNLEQDPLAKGTETFFQNFFPQLYETPKLPISGVELSDNCSASLFQLGSELFVAASTCYFRAVNSENLETGEKYDAKKLFGQNGFGVHPLTDSNGDVYNMGFSILPSLKYNVTKIPSSVDNNDSLETRLRKSRTLCSISSRWSGALAFNHSFGLSERYIVFVEQPYVVRVSKVLSAHVKGYSCKEWLDWIPQERNRFCIIEKSTGRVLNTEIMSHESFFFLHIVNCYEEGNQVVVDITSARDPFATNATNLKKLRNNEVDNIEASCIQRYVLRTAGNIKDLQDGENLVEKTLSCTATATRKGNTIIVTPEELSQRGVESVSINKRLQGKKHTFMYSGGTLFTKKNLPYAHSLCKIDAATKEVKLWTGTNSQFPGPCEPIFVPRKTVATEETDEDDGVIISTVESAIPTNQTSFYSSTLNPSPKSLEPNSETKYPVPSMESIYQPDTKEDKYTALLH